MRTVLLSLGLLSQLASGALAQTLFDHLKCHTVRDPLKVAATVDLPALQPAFSDQGCKLGKPKLLCVPAAKQNVSPPPPDPSITGQPLQDGYVCYRLRCPNRPADHFVVDQFGVHSQTRYRSSLLCVPARASVPPPPAPCVATVELDPNGVMTTLSTPQAVVQVRVRSETGGTFDLFLDDAAARGRVICPPAGCVAGASLSPTSTFDTHFNYFANVTPPTPVQLTAVVAPHDVGGACAHGSYGGYATKTFTTSSPTTTTPVRPPCIGTPTLDPDGVVTLQAGQPTPIPIVVTGNPGSIFDLLLSDDGGGGVFACPPAGCFMGIVIPPSGTVAVEATYTPGAGAPASVTLHTSITPHSVPFTCGIGSQGGTDMQTYPVAP